MQSLITTILTAVVLVHATFGCCFHHGHSYATCDSDTPSVDADACPFHEHEKYGNSTVMASLNLPDDCDQHQRHHGPDWCESGKCSFARTESSLGVDSLDAEIFLPVLIPPVSRVAQAPEYSFWRHSIKPDVASYALRRHLVLAVLLI